MVLITADSVAFVFFVGGKVTKTGGEKQNNLDRECFCHALAAGLMRSV